MLPSLFDVSESRRVIEVLLVEMKPEKSRATAMSARQERRDKLASKAVVMLHLRSCYVSKAAIFTIPSPP